MIRQITPRRHPQLLVPEIPVPEVKRVSVFARAILLCALAFGLIPMWSATAQVHVQTML